MSIFFVDSFSVSGELAMSQMQTQYLHEEHQQVLNNAKCDQIHEMDSCVCMIYSHTSFCLLFIYLFGGSGGTNFCWSDKNNRRKSWALCINSFVVWVKLGKDINGHLCCFNLIHKTNLCICNEIFSILQKLFELCVLGFHIVGIWLFPCLTSTYLMQPCGFGGSLPLCWC